MFKNHQNKTIKKVIKEHNRSLLNQQLIINKFSINEIEDYLSLIKKSFQTVAEELQMTKGIFPASGAFFDKNGFHKLLNKGAQLFGLYHKDDTVRQLIGCVAINSKDGRKYKIMKLAILPDYRKKGYGSLLMNFIEEYIFVLGGQAISLGMVLENEVLKNWYINRNYQIIKTSPYKKTNFNICFMEKRIIHKTDEASPEEVICQDCHLLVRTCNCSKTLNVNTDNYIWLLTHENETVRSTNTGQLIKEALPNNTKIFYWSRVNPPKELLQLLKDDDYNPILVFPVEDKDRVIIQPELLSKKIFLDGQHKKNAFIILDGTWKEARKMLRKSEYLSNLPFLTLENLDKTRYTLRRNKDIDHICTVEVAIELFKLCKEDEISQGLNRMFENFLSTYHDFKAFTTSK